MKGSKLPIILILLAILVQRMCFGFSQGEYFVIPFASDMKIYDPDSFNLLQLIYSFFPIPFLLFIFWGYGRNLIEGYGKLLLVRSYSRSRLVLVTILKISLLLLAIVLYQTLIFSLGNEKWQALEGKSYLLSLCFYYITLLCIIFTQFCIELHTNSQYANAIVNAFTIFALIAGHYFIPNDQSGIAVRIFLPNLAFASRNGILQQSYMTISASMAALTLLLILSVLITIAMISYRKKDIF